MPLEKCPSRSIINISNENFSGIQDVKQYHQSAESFLILRKKTVLFYLLDMIYNKKANLIK